MKILLLLAFSLICPLNVFSQMPPPEALAPGVSQELAKWRAARYSDVRYKLNLTLEKMSPVLRGTVEIRVSVSSPHVSKGSSDQSTIADVPIILDWRKIKGHEEKSTVSNIVLNGKAVNPPVTTGGSDTEHLVFRDGVVAGENVIKLDFTSPILTSGSAITRYVDKEDGSEYLYSLFVPSDASTAFPVFDQPDLKARFTLDMSIPASWTDPITNTGFRQLPMNGRCVGGLLDPPRDCPREYYFAETKPISTYVFAFAAGPWERVADTVGNPSNSEGVDASPSRDTLPIGRVSASGAIYVRKSQAAKFKPHADEVFRLNREAVKYFEEYFNFKYPFPKYDLVLIPEFPFGGMEHAGATFLREASVIFPQEPTKNDLVNRATLIFHETAHQWFGDTVTMRWFDDLWLKEGFATFMGYKALEKIMPEMNAWKVFYERIKQGAYQTDSTKGTTPIYQEIKNLSAAKSAYGNIVYNKAPAFLRQAEFYLGEDKFQTAVRAFLKKHEFGNAGWEDLVKEFEAASGRDVQEWAKKWVTQRGLPIIQAERGIDDPERYGVSISASDALKAGASWQENLSALIRKRSGNDVRPLSLEVIEGKMGSKGLGGGSGDPDPVLFYFPNYLDHGYGIFLLDEKSRDYVLKNIQNEKDPFLRSMMWGSLWDSVREGELDPRQYVELAIKNLPTELDESIVASILSRTATAMNYYLSEPPPSGGGQSGKSPNWPAAHATGSDLGARLENILIERLQNAPTLGQRITFYRAFLNIASSETARNVLKGMLKGGNPSDSEGVASPPQKNTLPNGRVSASDSKVAPLSIPIKTKDKFDIIARLLILNDPEAPRLLADLERTETSDDAKRYAYAAKAGIATAENKAKYWNDFTANKEISESWIEAAFGPWNSIRHSKLTLPYLQKALQELPNHKRNRKIFFVNGWLGAFIGGQRSEEALAIVNKFLADNPDLDNDLRLKILENVDLIERAVRIRAKYK